MFDTSIAADVPWDVTPEQAQSMTAEQATAALAVRHAALHPPPSVVPMDAQDARALIEIRSRDASFANALLSGSVAARKDGTSLTRRPTAVTMLPMPSQTSKSLRRYSKRQTAKVASSTGVIMRPS